MTRDFRRIVLAVALGVGVTGCGGTDTLAPVAVDTTALDGGGLARLLPSEPAMETLLGLPLDVRTDASGEQRRTAYYRPTDRAVGATGAGGYISLALYATEHAAGKALKGNLNYKQKRKVEKSKGVLKVFDLKDLADAGNGVVYREPGAPPSRQTIGVARIGRMVVEVALFHGTSDDRISAVREILERLRERLPRS